MASTLTVNGTGYSQSARKANSLIVDAYCAWDLDGDGWLEFHEYQAGYQPKFTGPATVSFNDSSGTLRFTGDITGVQPGWSDEGRTWGYRCAGLKYRGNLLPVTGVDGANTMAYNLNLDDEEYLASNAGKSLGDIIAAVLTQHATALGAAGIATDGTTTSQLATFTIVPNNPVYVQGERLLDVVEWVLRQYAGNARLLITPAGKIRFVDTTAGAAHTLTLGVDPVDPPLFSRDWTTCGTRVVVRGKGDIFPFKGSILAGTLQKAWTAPQQAAWTMADFEKPGDGYDKGTVTTTGGPTSITIQSSNGATAWPTNFWSSRQAWVYLEKSTGTGLTYSESRPVTACSSMSAGGTATLTLGLALDNSASTAWDSYTLVGKAGDLASGRNDVYRLMNVVTPGNWVERHLVKQFPQPVPFIGLNNITAQLITTPSCMILYQGGSGVPATFRIVPSTGQILFDRPYVEPINQASDLALGGAHVIQPDDIIFLLAYSRGALTAPYPADIAGVPQYAGTAFTIAGLQRTLTADVESWRYRGNQATMVSLAQMLHTSRCDTIIGGSVRYKGEYTTVLDPGAGHKLSFASNCGTTGDESLNVPVRSVTVKYAISGGGLLATTEITVSSRRDPRTSEGYYMHLSQFGSGVASSGVNPYAGASFGGVSMGDSGSSGGGDFSGGGFGFGSMGDGVNRYQRKRQTKPVGAKSSTVGSRAANAQSQAKSAQQVRDAGEAKAAQHQTELEAARQKGKAKATQHQEDLEAARSSGYGGQGHENDLQAQRDQGNANAQKRRTDAMQTRRAGKKKADQHQEDLEAARNRGNVKEMLGEAGFTGSEGES